MSLAQFAKGLGYGLGPGIELAGELDRQREVKAGREVSELLGEMGAYDPFALNDSSAQGIPQEGQTPAANPNQGFSGDDFSDIQSRLYKAMGGVSDPRAYAQIMETMGTMKMNRVNEYIDRGIAAYDQGDTKTAAAMLRGASAFTSPGYTPEITVDPKTGAFVVANYKDGEPVGGYAISRDQLMDLRWQNTNWEGWARQEKADEEFNRQMALQHAKFAASQKSAAAAAARAMSKEEREKAKHELDMATGQLELDTARLGYSEALATSDSRVASTIATNNKTEATDTAALEAIPTQIEEDIALNEAATSAARLENYNNQTALDAAQDAPTLKLEDDIYSGFVNYTSSIPAPKPPATDDAGTGGIAGEIAAAEGEEFQTTRDPWFTEELPDGTFALRKGLDSTAHQVAKDLATKNPDMSDAQGSYYIYDMLGPMPVGRFEDTDDGQTYYNGPTGRVLIDGGLATAVENFRAGVNQQRVEEAPTTPLTPERVGPEEATEAPPALAQPAPATPLNATMNPNGPISPQPAPPVPGAGGASITPAMSSGAIPDDTAVRTGQTYGTVSQPQGPNPMGSGQAKGIIGAMQGWLQSNPGQPLPNPLVEAIYKLSPQDQALVSQAYQQLTGQGRQ